MGTCDLQFQRTAARRQQPFKMVLTAFGFGKGGAFVKTGIAKDIAAGKLARFLHCNIPLSRRVRTAPNSVRIRRVPTRPPLENNQATRRRREQSLTTTKPACGH